MLYYIIFGVILATVLLVLLIEFIHDSHEKFKKKLKFFGIILIVFVVLIIMTRFPQVISVIPAVFLILFRWRFLINFLVQTFLKNPKNNKFSKNIDEQEAFEILGLKKGASRKEIIDKYQELMKKNHPDKGGSDWITKKLNKARDILLG